MSKLTDKVTVVTGASKGIGTAIAKALAAEGAAVVVNYAPVGAMPTRWSWRSRQRVARQAIQGDVSKSGDVERLFVETVTEDDFHHERNASFTSLLSGFP